MEVLMRHEEYIHAIRDIVIKYQSDAAIKDKLAKTKLVYGVGNGSYRGICYYGAWKNGEPKPIELVEIAATGEQSPVQLAGTTIHELGHVIAGHTAGHGKDWKTVCEALGLLSVRASGQQYAPEHFAPHIWADVERLAPSDGTPIFGMQHGAPFLGLPPAIVKPCPLGIGTRGGKSRGVGSGSRMRKFVCACVNPKTQSPIPVRRASDTFNATCHDCCQKFTRADEPRVNAQETEPNEAMAA
jgi:hypothetical protein